MTEKVLLIPLLVIGLLVGLSWRLWFIVGGFAVALVFVACSRPDDDDDADDSCDVEVEVWP